jgi:hypothetical protein
LVTIIARYEGKSDAQELIIKNTNVSSGFVYGKIKPKGAKASGGRWRVDGGRWRKNRVLLDVAEGTHSITFKPIDGWQTPTEKIIVVTPEQTTKVVGKYDKVP